MDKEVALLQFTVLPYCNAARNRMASILKSAIEKIRNETRNSSLRDSCKEALDYLLSETQSTQLYGLGSGDAFWIPFKLACHPALPPRVREVALDGIQKLLAHGLLNGATPLSVERTADISQQDTPESDPRDLMQTHFFLIDEIISIICSCYSYSALEDPVQLQVLKVLLTIVTCDHCQITPIFQLSSRIVESCFSIHVNSRSPINSGTAKASLTQITNIVYQKLKKNFITRRESDYVDAHTSPVKSPQNDSINFSSTSSEKDNPVSNIAPSIDEEGTLEPFKADVGNLESSSSRSPDPQSSESIHNAQKSFVQTNSFKLARKDAMQMFRLLCRVSMQTDNPQKTLNADGGLTDALASLPVDEISNLTLRARLLALEMILSIFNNAGPIFINDELTIKIVRQYLCLSISRNGISTNSTLFELSLSIFLLVIRHLRHLLKNEIGIILNTVYLHILEMHNSTFAQKSLLLQALLKISENPQILSDIFINYDCDLNSVSLFEKSVTICCKLAQSKTSSVSAPSGTLLGMAATAAGFDGTKNDQPRLQEKMLRVKSLGCLSAIVKSLVIWSTNKTFQSKGVSIDLDSEEKDELIDRPLTIVVGKNPLHTLMLSQIDHSRIHTHSLALKCRTENLESEDNGSIIELAGKKQRFAQGIALFNTKPSKGMALLIETGFLKESAIDVAKFLLSNSDLAKFAIGEYIGDGNNFNKQVMYEFIDLLDFKAKGFVEALRYMLQTFRLPGEAQKIDRIMEKFADRYCENNPNIFAKADTAYTLAYSVIMLNVDQHSPQIKHRMDKLAFIKNNRGINDNEDLPEEYLSAIFDEIVRNEIILKEEHIKISTDGTKDIGVSDMNELKKRELYNLEVAQIQKKSHQLIRSALKAPFTPATQKELARPMFSLVSWPMMAAFSLIFEAAVEEGETSSDPNNIYDPLIVQYCLEGFENGIYLSCIFKLETVRDAYISSLANLSGLSQIRNLKMKNVRAINSLFGLALSLGEYLDESWLHVMKIISQIERLNLALTGDINEDKLLIENETFDKSGKTIHTHYNVQVLGLIADPSSDEVINQVTGQSLALLVDQLFNHSAQLSAGAIIHYFRCMCLVSLEEVGFILDQSDESRRSSSFAYENMKSLASNHLPRIYLLQKIVEVAYYNIDRIRFEWAQIWKILQRHFNILGCHDNQTISTFTIDSMRQMCMKFLEREELANYNTQSQFLKSFEWIMRRTGSNATRELIVNSIFHMIRSKAKQIRSGWSSILVTLSNVCNVSQSPGDDIIEKSFQLVQIIYTEYFEIILSSGTFTDLISCLTEFVLIKEEDAIQDEIITNALNLLQQCSKFIMNRGEEIKTFSRRESHAGKQAFLNETVSSPVINHGDYKRDDIFYLKWFPIFSAFSRIALDSSSDLTQTKGLDLLFELLNETCHLFEASHWKNIIQSVICPLFENLEDVEAMSQEESARYSISSYRSLRNEKSSVLIQGLRQLVNLTNSIFDTLMILQNGDSVFELVIDTIISMYARKNEKFATTAGICLQKLLETNMHHIVGSNAEYMEIATLALERSFELTIPAELLNCEYQIRGSNESLTPAKDTLPDQIEDIAANSSLSISYSHEVLPSDSTLTVLSYVSQKGKEIAQNICVKKLTLDSLEFNQVIMKCGIHLEFIDSLGNLLLTSIPTELSEPGHPLIILLSRPFRARWLSLIYGSYCIARSFNANYDLRQAIWKKGLIQQLPNLIKQETLSCSLYIRVLFELYRHEGDSTPTENRSDLTENLLRETIDALQRFNDLLSDQLKNVRDINVWASVIIMIYSELIQFEGLWKKDESKYIGLRDHLVFFNRLSIKMIVCEKLEVRLILQKFLERMEQFFSMRSEMEDKNE